MHNITVDFGNSIKTRYRVQFINEHNRYSYKNNTILIGINIKLFLGIHVTWRTTIITARNMLLTVVDPLASYWILFTVACGEADWRAMPVVDVVVWVPEEATFELWNTVLEAVLDAVFKTAFDPECEPCLEEPEPEDPEDPRVPDPEEPLLEPEIMPLAGWAPVLKVDTELPVCVLPSLPIVG